MIQTQVSLVILFNFARWDYRQTSGYHLFNPCSGK